MLELLGGALGIGWPLFVFLIGLLIYFQVSIPDAAKKKRLSFKTLIGMLAGFMAFMAISNYGNRHEGDGWPAAPSPGKLWGDVRQKRWN